MWLRCYGALLRGTACGSASASPTNTADGCELELVGEAGAHWRRSGWEVEADLLIASDVGLVFLFCHSVAGLQSAQIRPHYVASSADSR